MWIGVWHGNGGGRSIFEPACQCIMLTPNIAFWFCILLEKPHHCEYSNKMSSFPINWAYFHIKLYPQAKRHHDICVWCNCIYSGLWKLAREIWIIWILCIIYTYRTPDWKLKLNFHTVIIEPHWDWMVCAISMWFHPNFMWKKKQKPSQISLDHRIL